MWAERAWSDGTAQAVCTGRDRLKAVGGQGTRGAHVEHVAHGRDLGRVEAERLVERRRFLPSRKAGMRYAPRCGPGGMKALGVAATQAARTGRDRLKAAEARARAERTLNMRYMSVTLDVSKLSGWLNTDAYCRLERRACGVGRGATPEAREGAEIGTDARRGPDSRLRGPGHAWSAPGTCCPWS